MTAIGLIREAAQNALGNRDHFKASGELEALEQVEIDCVDTVKHLLRDDSPVLRRAVVNLAIAQALPLAA